MVKKIFSLLSVIVVGVFIAFPLFHPGFYPTHDGEYHIIRFYEFFKVLQDGVIYPRWAPDLNNGFGLPLFSFVYPLPNYIASFFHIFGLSFIDSFKMSMIIGLILSGIFFYLWVREFVSEKSSIVASIFFMSAPYHILDIIIRGSIGEVWALAFFPGFLWAITRYKKNTSNKNFALSVIFLSLTIISHNILGLMFFSFSIVYAVWLGCFSIKNMVKTVGIYGLSLGITAVFWLPALLEKKYVTGLELYDIKSNFVDLYQLIVPSWGSGFFNSPVNPMSVQIGVANILIVILSLCLAAYHKQYRREIVFFVVAFFCLILLMLPVSDLVWRYVPLMNFFQFPWRLLSLVIVTTSFLSGIVTEIIKPKWILYVLGALPILLAIGYNTPAYYFDRNDEYYISRGNFIHGTNSPGDYFNTIWIKSKEIFTSRIATASGVVISNVGIKSQSYTFDISTQNQTNLIVNTAYFPGWTAYIDEHEENVEISEKGLILIAIPEGKHFMRILFSDTLTRQMAALLSLTSLCLLCVISTRKAVLQ